MSILNDIKKTVHHELGGPSFDIHMTVSGPLFKIDSFTDKKLNNLTNQISQFSIKPLRCGFSDQYFTSLYIEIFKSPKLLSLKKYIDDIFNLKTRKYMPHISLFYGREDSKVKEKIIRLLPNLPKEIVVKSICLVNVDEEIENWKILNAYKLA